MRVLLFILVMAFCGACASSKSRRSADLNGEWELVSFSNSTKTFDEVFAEHRPSLNFDGSKSSVSGSTGCNRLSGSFKRTGTSGLLFGNNIVTTRMACAGYEESTFVTALNQINSYQVMNGQLRLMHDSTLIMAFRKL